MCKKTTLADTPAIVQQLLKQLTRWAADPPHSFLTERLTAFGKLPEDTPLQDALWKVPADPVQQELQRMALQLAFGTAADYVETAFADYLQCGKYGTLSARQREELRAALPHNLAAEAAFAQLDNIKRQMPGASVAAAEGQIAYRANQTGEWQSY